MFHLVLSLINKHIADLTYDLFSTYNFTISERKRRKNPQQNLFHNKSNQCLDPTVSVLSDNNEFNIEKNQYNLITHNMYIMKIFILYVNLMENLHEKEK